ncbi:hypothetical protein PENTCL1PPCAC_19402, partial [Pristionchus entomophagus]
KRGTRVAKPRAASKKGMATSSSPTSIDTRSARKRKNEEATGDYFPILGLPTELVSHSISFLSMKDRLRVAGVNKKLRKIDSESKNMLSGSTKLRMFQSLNVSKKIYISFFKLIGITYKDGRFFSNRDIEVYKDRTITTCDLWTIFDEGVEIQINGLTYATSRLTVIFHETHEQLEEAKNKNEL